jgi:dynein heavy chain
MLLVFKENANYFVENLKKLSKIVIIHRWASRAYASLNGLSNWYADLLLRIKELESWTADFSLPTSVWLSGFFNPQSFLTAIMQSTARC